MDRRAARPRLLRISLRELLLLLGLCAVGCAALKYAGDGWWTILSTGALLLFLAAAVTAAVDRGRPQAVATGFVLAATIYALLLYAAPRDGSEQSRELDPYNGKLPTTRLLKPLFEAIVSRTWIDGNTGQEISNYDGSPSAGGFFGGMGPAVHLRESPPRESFMAIGHLLWTLLLGYFGARLADYLYLRRQPHPTPNDAEQAG